MKNPNEMNNLNYYFGGNRGFDTLTLLMDYPGNTHGRPEVRSFVKRIEKLIHGRAEDYENGAIPQKDHQMNAGTTEISDMEDKVVRYVR